MPKRKLTKKQLRIRKATNIAASLVHSGVAKADVSRLSKRTLSAALQKERVGTPKAKAISEELAISDIDRSAARKKKIKVR